MYNKDIFEKIENSLMSRMNLDREEFDKRFSDAKLLKFENKSDDWYFDVLKFITFYSSFKAESVANKVDVINKHFPNIETVAKYGENEIKQILADEKMIKHPEKIKSVVKNAKICLKLIKEFGSVHNYLESLKPEEDLMNFYKIVKDKFATLGIISTFLFMNEIGLNAVKPNLILTRTFKRLGLIVDPSDFWNIIEEARKFSSATAYPIRYIEMIFVLFGEDTEYGICIGNPNCEICPIQDNCVYYANDKKLSEDDEKDVVRYYCKAEPSGEVIYAKLDESEIADLRKYYMKKEFDSLDWRNSPADMNIIEHLTAMFGVCGMVGDSNVVNCHELPTKDGFYILTTYLSKYSLEFDIIPNDGEPFDEDKFTTDVVEFRFGDFIQPYGEDFDHDLHYYYSYDGEEIEGSDSSEMIDRGIDYYQYIFQVKDGERSMIYQNERDRVTWGKFLD